MDVALRLAKWIAMLFITKSLIELDIHFDDAVWWLSVLATLPFVTWMFWIVDDRWKP